MVGHWESVIRNILCVHDNSRTSPTVIPTHAKGKSETDDIILHPWVSPGSLKTEIWATLQSWIGVIAILFASRACTQCRTVPQASSSASPPGAATARGQDILKVFRKQTTIHKQKHARIHELRVATNPRVPTNPTSQSTVLSLLRRSQLCFVVMC